MRALDVAQRYFDAWNRRAAAAIVATFAEGGTYTDPSAGRLTGEAIGAYASSLWAAFPDLSFEVISAAEAGDGRVAAQWVMRGTNAGPLRGLPPTGRAVALPGADFIEVAGDKIRSVTGYFDTRVLPEQLGLQVIVQPRAVGPFTFGTSIAAQAGSRVTPGAFSITAIHLRSEQEVQQVRDYSRQIATEMLQMPGFIGWVGAVLGRRMLPITAWEDQDSPRQLTRGGCTGK